tara:strand:+ start:269 stop:520 length:252 start_codon:yes stop_codon:yes gene_type:complete
MSFGKIYETTWWGNPVNNGWGGIYYNLFINELTSSFQTRVLADGGTIESLTCVNAATSDFVVDFLLKDDNGFLLQENGFKIIL